MPLSSSKAQRRVSQCVTLPAPTGGINDLDPLASMDPSFCIRLDNFYPDNGAIRTRLGYQEWATNIGAPVDTLIPMNLADGSQKLFAATDIGIFDVTNTTSTPAVVAAITEGVCSYAQFTNVAGQWLVVCNGVDPALLYNGNTDTWTPFVETATPANPGEITGVDPAALSKVHAYKNRLWFVVSESLAAYYLDLDQVGGTANPFYVGGVVQRGGALAYLATWSFDSGVGLDDKLLFCTTAGEVAIYSGDDPSQADMWALEAVFFASAPVGTSPSADFGGDVLMLTRAGVIPVSTMAKGKLNFSLSEDVLSKRISRTLSRLIHSQSFANDWGIINIPGLQSIVIIIPKSSSTPAQQFVMNSLTGAWGRYTLPARSGAMYNRQFYFGSDDGKVYVFGNQGKDGVLLDGTGGVAVQSAMFSAFNYLGDPTTNKHFKLIRPMFQTSTPPSYLARLNVDYDLSSLVGVPTVPGESSISAIWDADLWDNCFWSGVSTVYSPWLSVNGLGFCAALLLGLTTTNETYLAAVEIVYEPGGAV